MLVIKIVFWYNLIVFLTSNSQRTLLDETKDRCLFLYIPYPDLEREIEIVKSKVPEANDDLIRKVVSLVQNIRTLNLLKKPSVRGSVDWVKSLMGLNEKDDNQALKNSIGAVIKNESDKKRVLKEFFD